MSSWAWVASHAFGKSRARFGTGLEAPILLFMGIAILQIVPLPPAAISVLSPRASALYERTVPGYARAGGPNFDDWLLESDGTRARIAPVPLAGSKAVPVSYSPPLTWDRIRLFAAYALLFLLAAVAVLLLTYGQDLRSRSAQISVGMPREQVEDILGPPVLVLGRTGDRGAALIWVDQFWQVDVRTGPDGRVESVGWMPSDSLYRRTVGRLSSLP